MHCIPYSRHQNAVNSTQFDVDLETEVGESLGGGTHNVLKLDTLRGHTQHCITHTLHLGYIVCVYL